MKTAHGNLCPSQRLRAQRSVQTFACSVPTLSAASSSYWNNQISQLIAGGVKNENIDGHESGSDGISFNLAGRNVSLRILPDYDVQDEGIVVVIITVNRNGIVTNAITGSKGTTTFNKNLLLKAKQAALKTRFSVNNNAPISQQGKIIYNFKLN